jgi:hypothetical protein
LFGKSCTSASRGKFVEIKSGATRLSENVWLTFRETGTVFIVTSDSGVIGFSVSVTVGGLL